MHTNIFIWKQTVRNQSQKLNDFIQNRCDSLSNQLPIKDNYFIELFWIVTQTQFHRQQLPSNTPLKMKVEFVDRNNHEEGLEASATQHNRDITSTAGRLQIFHFNTYKLWLLRICRFRFYTRAVVHLLSPLLYYSDS